MPYMTRPPDDARQQNLKWMLLSMTISGPKSDMISVHYTYHKS